MVYRRAWVDEEARRLDDAEIATFCATLRARWRLRILAVGLAMTTLGALVLLASTVPPERHVEFVRKAGCVYDGCFCRRSGESLARTACPPPATRECLPIAERCD